MERKPLTTEAVLNKAFELATINGIDSVTYNGLARELGIRPQSMYRYVPDIKTLHVCMLTHFLDELTDRIATAMRELNPWDALKAFSVTMYDECHRHSRYYQSFELMHQYDVIPDLHDPLLNLGSLVEEQMALIIPEASESARMTQMFVALNLGYAQMSMTQFIPASLADSREMFLKSVNEFVDQLKQESTL